MQRRGYLNDDTVVATSRTRLRLAPRLKFLGRPDTLHRMQSSPAVGFLFFYLFFLSCWQTAFESENGWSRREDHGLKEWTRTRLLSLGGLRYCISLYLRSSVLQMANITCTLSPSVAPADVCEWSREEHLTQKCWMFKCSCFNILMKLLMLCILCVIFKMLFL